MNLHLGTLQIQNLFSEQNDKPVTGFQSFAKLFTESQTTDNWENTATANGEALKSAGFRLGYVQTIETDLYGSNQLLKKWNRLCLRDIIIFCNKFDNFMTNAH